MHDPRDLLAPFAEAFVIRTGVGDHYITVDRDAAVLVALDPEALQCGSLGFRYGAPDEDAPLSRMENGGQRASTMRSYSCPSQ